MPGMKLYCAPEDVLRLKPYVEVIIGPALVNLSANVLQVHKVVVSFRIFQFEAGYNAPRFEMVLVADSGMRLEAIRQWKAAIAMTWHDLYRHTRLSEIKDVFLQLVITTDLSAKIEQ